MASRDTPPFRADHVGSLLRPQSILDARKRYEAGAISATALRDIEDESIRRLVRRQEDVGLRVVTDGELRRSSWHMDFLCRIGGVESAGTQLRPFRNETGEVRNEIALPKVVDRLHLDRIIYGEDLAFLASITQVTPKLSIPSPSMLDGLGTSLEGNGIYAERDQLLADLVRVYREQLQALDRVGCRYLQIDDTMFAMLADPTYRQKIRATTGDPDRRHLDYIRILNEVLAVKPSGMTICVHTCRGNHRSAWVAAGGYDPVAEAVFSELDVDGFFLEYDDERSGDFSALRFMPKGKAAVLGLVTSKSGRLEKKDDIKRRIDDAARFVDLDQICLSPQCGFASTLEGNLLTEDEQFAKLALVVEIARDVWGSA
jgi:5-methyltetrahydropteroyltriglutamate--homocysteine methyltransferase